MDNLCMFIAVAISALVYFILLFVCIRRDRKTRKRFIDLVTVNSLCCDCGEEDCDESCCKYD